MSPRRFCLCWNDNCPDSDDRVAEHACRVAATSALPVGIIDLAEPSAPGCFYLIFCAVVFSAGFGCISFKVNLHAIDLTAEISRVCIRCRPITFVDLREPSAAQTVHAVFDTSACRADRHPDDGFDSKRQRPSGRDKPRQINVLSGLAATGCDTR